MSISSYESFSAGLMRSRLGLSSLRNRRLHVEVIYTSRFLQGIFLFWPFVAIQFMCYFTLCSKFRSDQACLFKIVVFILVILRYRMMHNTDRCNLILRVKTYPSASGLEESDYAVIFCLCIFLYLYCICDVLLIYVQVDDAGFLFAREGLLTFMKKIDEFQFLRFISFENFEM